MTKEQEKQWYRENANIAYDFLSKKPTVTGEKYMERDEFLSRFLTAMHGYDMNGRDFIHAVDYDDNEFSYTFGRRVVEEILGGAIPFIQQPS